MCTEAEVIGSLNLSSALNCESCLFVFKHVLSIHLKIHM